MSTHWKKLTNPNYMGSYVFENNKQEIIGTIDHITTELVVGESNKKDSCTVAYFKEKDLKPLILNSTNCKTISKLYKTPYVEDWKNRAIIMVVREVRAFGEPVEAIRIKNEIPKIKATTILCVDCNAELQAVNGKTPESLANYTQGKYGKVLCADCAKKANVDKLELENKSVSLSEAIKAKQRKDDDNE